ncbi:MAG: hypothetical protein AB7S61_08670 [Methanoregulaceae archaeon]
MSTSFPDALIQELLASFEVTENGGITYGNGNIQRYKILSTLLLEQLLDDDNNHFDRKLRGLRITLPRKLDGVILPIEVAAAAKRQQISSYSELKTIFQQFVTDLSRRPRRRYRCLIPVNVNFHGVPFSYADKNIKITAYPFSEFREILSGPEIEEGIRQAESFDLNIDFSDFTVFETEVYARNSLYAEGISYQFVKFILGVLAFLLTFHSYSMRLLGTIGPITDINQGLFFVFEEESFLHPVAFSLIESGVEVHPVSAQQIQTVITMLQKYRQASPPVQTIVVDAFSAYHEGVTEKRVGHAFFFFWTCVELLALKHERLSEWKVRQRLRCIFMNITTQMALELDRFYSVRNKIAHRAKFASVSEFDRDRMKFFTENFLDYFITNMMQLRIGEIHKKYDELCQIDDGSKSSVADGDA